MFICRYPALCVNPMCIEDYDEVRDNQMVVRSFKSGKFFTVSRCERLTRSNIPSKVEPVWKGEDLNLGFLDSCLMLIEFYLFIYKQKSFKLIYVNSLTGNSDGNIRKAFFLVF